MGDFSIRLAGLESIYPGKLTSVEPDLSLVQNKFSVRYESEQSLEIESSLFRFHFSARFYIFIRFQACYVARHPKASISF